MKSQGWVKVLLEQLNVHFNGENPRVCLQQLQGLRHLPIKAIQLPSFSFCLMITGPRRSSQPAIMSATRSSERPRNSLGEKKSRSNTVRQRMSAKCFVFSFLQLYFRLYLCIFTLLQIFQQELHAGIPVIL